MRGGHLELFFPLPELGVRVAADGSDIQSPWGCDHRLVTMKVKNYLCALLFIPTLFPLSHR